MARNNLHGKIFSCEKTGFKYKLLWLNKEVSSKDSYKEIKKLLLDLKTFDCDNRKRKNSSSKPFHYGKILGEMRDILKAKGVHKTKQEFCESIGIKNYATVETIIKRQCPQRRGVPFLKTVIENIEKHIEQHKDELQI